MKISPNLINLMEMNDVLMFYKGKMANTSARYGFMVCPYAEDKLAVTAEDAYKIAQEYNKTCTISRYANGIYRVKPVFWSIFREDAEEYGKREYGRYAIIDQASGQVDIYNK